MKSNPSYTVTVQGTDFLLTKSQIELDAPNYFTTCFLGDFEESKTLHLKISRDPALFRIISDYLCGYTVLPLVDGVIPARMSPTLAVANLKVDAEFYQLHGLVQQCETWMAEEKEGSGPSKRYLVLGCEYEYPSGCDFEDHVQGTSKSDSRHWRTIITGERLNEDPFFETDTPKDWSGFSGLRKLAAIERYAREMGCGGHSLVCWSLDIEDERSHPNANVTYQLMVVLAL